MLDEKEKELRANFDKACTATREVAAMLVSEENIDPEIVIAALIVAASPMAYILKDASRGEARDFLGECVDHALNDVSEESEKNGFAAGLRAASTAVRRGASVAEAQRIVKSFIDGEKVTVSG